jgi:hypothetical protein
MLAFGHSFLFLIREKEKFFYEISRLLDHPIYQLARVTRHLKDGKFEFNILTTHYCHIVEHSRKHKKSYFARLMSTSCWV